MSGPWEQYQQSGPWQQYQGMPQKQAVPEVKQDIFGGSLDENTIDAITGGVDPRDLPRHLDNTVRMLANGATFGLADKFAGGMNYLTNNTPNYDEGVGGNGYRVDR